MVKYQIPVAKYQWPNTKQIPIEENTKQIPMTRGQAI
jgi:hypothetical protein